VKQTGEYTVHLSGRRFVLAVCGGIAAYKSAELVSRLVQSGASVEVCMTENAGEFVTPVTFQALSGRPVHTKMWYRSGDVSPDHLGLTEKADMLVVAPATANILAKAASGICDDLVSTLLCASACPILFAPAMNHRMWLNPVTQRNVKTLKDVGHAFIGPEEGRMAEGTFGPGRMSEPAAILLWLHQRFASGG